jgi:hypothetical protein
MKTAHSIVISIALGAGLLIPAVSQAHVDVNVSLGLPVVQIAAAPVVITAAPAPVEYIPARVHYVEGPRFEPAPLPPHHYAEPRHDDHRWDDHPDHFRR